MDQKTKIEAAGFFRKEYSKLKNYIRSYISDKPDYNAEDIIQDVALNLFSRVDSGRLYLQGNPKQNN